ncbi:hypothetical protein Tco_1086086 [Tanacetum coccineum]
MSPPDTNNTYTKHPLENQILGFIKTLGYDEDPDTKMIVVSKIVATRPHQPWKAILSVLNRNTYAELVQKFKGHIVKDLAVQALLDLWKGSKASKLKNTDSDTIIYSSCLEESDSETDDVDDSDMDLSDDSSQRKINDAIEIKRSSCIKLLPSHIPKVVSNFVRPRLNTCVLEVMKNNQINLFTQSSTSTDDLSEIDLKLKLFNRIHLNKSNKTHTTHQQLYDTLYESITLYQDALNAEDAKPSFHKRSHDNQDPPNNREGENKKKRRKDVGEPHSRSSRKNIYPMVNAQDDTPAIQALDPSAEYSFGSS